MLAARHALPAVPSAAPLYPGPVQAPPVPVQTRVCRLAHLLTALQPGPVLQAAATACAAAAVGALPQLQATQAAAAAPESHAGPLLLTRLQGTHLQPLCGQPEPTAGQQVHTQAGLRCILQ